MTIRTPDWVKSILSAGVPDIVVDKLTGTEIDATDILVNSVVADEVDVTTLNNVEIISDQSDLPDPSGGTHTLEPMTPYIFDTFVTSDAGLELGSMTPILGHHGGASGFVHTGGQTAIVGDNVPYFQDSLSVSAPGGTLYDLSSTGSDEILVESSSFADFLDMGNFASLGTVDGFRVPSWKGCNFEEFDGGLTFTGSNDKIFFSECPFRNIDSAGVTIFTLDSGLSTEIVDVTDCFIEGVRSDTVVFDVDPAATIGSVFQYRGTTHYPSVTPSNILTGQVGVRENRTRVSDSFPLANSRAFGQYSIDQNETVTITTTASSKTDESAYVKPTASTTLYNDERFTQPANNELRYGSPRFVSVELNASLSVSADGATVVAAWFKNGSLVPGTPTRVATNQQGGGIAKSLTTQGAAQDSGEGDIFDVRVANLTTTDNIEIGELNGYART